MTKHKIESIGIIGNGIAAAFAAGAAKDSGISDITIYGVSPTIVTPPPGAFYLYEIPGFSSKNLRPQTIVELRHGDNPDLYAQNMGVDRETSAHRLIAPRSRPIYSPDTLGIAEIMRYLTRSARFVTGFIKGAKALDEVRTSHDLVLCTTDFNLVRYGIDPQYDRIGVVKLNNLSYFDSGRLYDRYPGLREAAYEIWSEYGTFSVYNCHSSTWLRMTCLAGQDMLEIPEADFISLRNEGIINEGNSVLAPKPNERAIPMRSSEARVALIGRFAQRDRSLLAHDSYHQSIKAISQAIEGIL